MWALARLALILSLTCGVLPGFGRAQTVTGTLTLGQGENDVYASAYFDGFYYAGTNTQPGMVAKVATSTFSEVDVLRFQNSSYSRFHSAIVDPTAGILYMGTYTNPTYIAKVDLATFTNTDTLTVTGAQFVKAMAIDHNATTPVLYVGTAESPGVVVRIDLTTFTEDSTAVANAGENNFQSMEIDTDLGMIFLGTYTSPGYIVRFATSNMTRLDSVFYPNVNSYLSSCSDATYAYFATYSSPAYITRLDKATFTITGVLRLGSNAIYVQSASIDMAAQTAYFGTYQSPGRVAIVDLTTFTHNNRTVMLPAGANLIYTSAIAETGGSSAVYFGTGNSPGVIARLDTTPTSAPTGAPTDAPTQTPTGLPTAGPTTRPTSVPSARPTRAPIVQPTRDPTPAPTTRPSRAPVLQPTVRPTRQPTGVGTPKPTPSPTSRGSKGPSPAPTARPTAPTAHPTGAPTPIPLSDFTLRPSPSPTQPVPPQRIPVALAADTNRVTVYPGLTFQYNVRLRSLATQKYVCDPLCHYVYGDFGLDVFLPPSLRLVRASSVSSGIKGSDFFPAVEGGNVSWPNAPVGASKSLEYKMTLEVVQDATAGQFVISAVSHQNILDLAGQVIGTCCITHANPSTIEVVTTTRRPAGSNASYINKQADSNMAGKDGTSVVEPVFANAGAKFCDECRTCLNAYKAPSGSRRRLFSNGRTGPCSDVCEKCPSFVEANAGTRLTLQSPTIVMDGNTTINGEVTINAPDFNVRTSGSQSYAALEELYFSSVEETIMTSETSWAAIAKESAELRAGQNLALDAGGLASLKSETLTFDTLGRSLMLAANHTGKTSGRMLYKVGTTLEWEVVDATTLLTGTYVVSATGAGGAGRRLQGEDYDGTRDHQRALQAGPPTTMQVASDGFSVSTQGDVNVQCTDFAAVATNNVTIEATTLVTTTTGATTVSAGEALTVSTGGEATLKAATGVAIETPGVVQTEAFSIVGVAEGPYICESSNSEVFLKASGGVTAQTPATVLLEAGRNVDLVAGDTFDVKAPLQVFSGDQSTAIMRGNLDLEAGGNLHATSAGSMFLAAQQRVDVQSTDFSASLNNSATIHAASKLTCKADSDLFLDSLDKIRMISEGQTELTAHRVSMAATETLSNVIDTNDLENWFLDNIGNLDSLLSDFNELSTVFNMSAFSMGLSTDAKLDLKTSGIGSLSAGIIASMSSKWCAGIYAGEYEAFNVPGPLQSTIELGVGPEFLLPFPLNLKNQPQIEVRQGEINMRAAVYTFKGRYLLPAEFTFEGETNMVGALTVEGGAEVTGGFNVGGEALFGGVVNIGGITTCEVDLNVEGLLTANGGVEFNGAVNVLGEFTVEGVNIDLTAFTEMNVASPAITVEAAETEITGDVNILGGFQVEGLTEFIGNVNVAGFMEVEGDLVAGAIQTGDIAVGYIEALGCFECFPIRRRSRRRRLQLEWTEFPSAAPSPEPSAAPSPEPSAAPTGSPSTTTTTEPSAAPTGSPSASPTSEPSSSPSAAPDYFDHYPKGLSAKASARTSALMYSAVGRGLEDDYGLEGPFWRMMNPLHIMADLDMGASSVNKSALVVDGESQFYGSISILSEDLEGDNSHLAIGATPPSDFRATIPGGSLLLDGEGGGRLYASTSAKVAPIHRVTATCEVASGETKGTATITLAHAYLFGMVGGHTSSSGALPPTGLYVDSIDPAGGTEFTLHCEAFAAPGSRETFTYTAQLVFYHPVLAE